MKHLSEVRPWGRYEIIHEKDFFKVKIIYLTPGQRLSYQTHQRRKEHWTVVQGTGQVTLDGTTTDVRAGDNVLVGLEVPHRIANSGSEELIFVEVQTGDYFGEDDIVRIDDDYGRD